MNTNVSAGSGTQPRSPESGGQANVQDMSTTRNPFHYRRFRGPAPRNGHYPSNPPIGSPSWTALSCGGEEAKGIGILR